MNTVYTAIVQYKKEHGNSYVPRNYEKGHALGEWVYNQWSLRVDIQRGKTLSTPEHKSRSKKIEKFGFNWELQKFGCCHYISINYYSNEILDFLFLLPGCLDPTWFF
jgi:hypothetical protein